MKAMLGIGLLMAAMTVFQPVLGQTVISDQVVTTLENPQDPTSIEVGPDVIVEDGGHLYLNTPKVTITGPFSIEEGGLLTINSTYIVNVEEEEKPAQAAVFAVEQNYPNPFYSTTEIPYSLAEAGYVEVSIYNVLGQRVRQLAAGLQTAGRHRVVWDGRMTGGERAAYGVYYYTLRSADKRVTGKMLLVR